MNAPVAGGRDRRVSWGWLVVLAVLIWFAYVTRGVIGPFLAGLVIAYLLDPVTDRIEAKGLPRWAATGSVLLLFFGLFAALVVAMAPLVIAQFSQLVESLPQLIEGVRPLFDRLATAAGGIVDPAQVSGGMVERVVTWGTGLVSGIVASSLKVFNVLALVIIMPVVAFYALRDYDVLTSRIDGWWPRAHAETIRTLLADSDKALAGFIRGQSLVCLVLAVFYAAGWSIIGLDYSLVLGILAGVLGFVPYLGVAVSVGLSLLVGIGQFGLDPLHLGLIFGIFFVGQILEGSVLTPNLIGNRIGLHPLWVVFAVFAGGEIAGILGVFLAVPVAAVIGVFVRWLITEYLRSPLYGTDASARQDVDRTTT
jgi:predicted PurR-regulated permease PerM